MPLHRRRRPVRKGPSHRSHADWVNNDDLVPPAYPCGRSSCVHFGARAMREQGRRFDAALRRVLER